MVRFSGFSLIFIFWATTALWGKNVGFGGSGCLLAKADVCWAICGLGTTSGLVVAASLKVWVFGSFGSWIRLLAIVGNWAFWYSIKAFWASSLVLYFL